MKRADRILLALIVFLAGLFVLQPRQISSITAFLRGVTIETPADKAALQKENAALKAELIILHSSQSAFPRPTEHGIQARVYSRYPLAIKQELLTDMGMDDGVTVGAGVVSGGILIGRVEQAWKYSSRVLTIFDPRWKSAVRIGEKGVDALLTGGGTPRHTLIPKDAEIIPGDIVVNAANGFPVGIAIGSVGAAFPSADNFQEAKLYIPYRLDEMREVNILMRGTQ